MNQIVSELRRFWSMREVYIAFVPTVVLSLVFSVMNVSVINAVVTGDLESQNLDPSLADKPITDLLSEGYLGPVYQSAVIFIPITVAVLFHREYSYGDHEQILLFPRGLFARRIGTMITHCVWSLVVSVLSAVCNYCVLLVLLHADARAELSILTAAGVCLRVWVFAILFSLMALLVGALSQKLFASVVALLLVFFISLSGVLNVVSPFLHNCLPLIGGKSFVFLKASEGPYSIAGSLGLLCAWIVVCAGIYLALAVGKRR
ncbi:hypothetical protein EML15_04430 [Corynebacterium sp. sy017]|uniref:hypothetical protein n=1 Tax=unclassified Corynebacterium TaxID=2624378 RepID=UPI0011853554|nr:MULTISPECIES: hypothetical protein [unclassified Corynebacterium]MBP3088393.1 hypothetical protein [Corynebacterium sp. sy017]TSD91707.1 hypothetical protein ELY17_04430 [Corynebacterium sp. SY003]